MQYQLEITGSAATIGYLACSPAEKVSFEQALQYLDKCPMDDFMHRHLLRQMLGKSANEIKLLAAVFADSKVMSSLLAETVIQRPELTEFMPEKLPCRASSLVNLRQEKFTDMALHRAWSKIFSDNLLEHRPLPELEQAPPLPYSKQEIEQAGQGFIPVSKFAAADFSENTVQEPPLQEVIQRAETALEAAGVNLDRQMLHQSSLSPVGLVRGWQAEIAVQNGHLDYRLKGNQNSFGRGLDFDTAQTGLLMEICERFSSLASFETEGALGYAKPLPLIRSSYSRLEEDALDPACLPLEVPVDRNEILHWLPGSCPDGSRMLVPAQFVFLFANLDEPCLCSGLGSTGLGAGLDMNRARLTALLEVIERDAESTFPHHPARCFCIRSDDEAIAALLNEYAKRGIEVFFEDISSELGLPCYRSFVVGPEGQVTKGASADMNGAKACLSAMLEVPYPYPWGPPSRPAPKGLPVRTLEDLPDYSTASMAGDLAILEQALTASGKTPVYVNLTRADMNIPVCRAIIPDLELMADFDQNSRLSPRLFRNLLLKQ